MPQSSPFIVQTYKAAWPQCSVAVPKIEITPEWRERVAAAMTDQQISQERLGRMVGTSQNTIALILNGKHASSRYVAPICKVLGVPLPARYADDLARQLSELGEEIRLHDPEIFESLIQFAENLAASLRKKS